MESHLMDPEIKAMMAGLTAAQLQTDKSLNALMATVGQSHGVLDAAHLKTEAAIEALAVTVEKCVQAADVRMKRIEENLDGLIRAITREHTNGKGKV